MLNLVLWLVPAASSLPQPSYDFSKFPPKMQVTPPNPSFSAMFNLSLVPKNAPSLPAQNTGPIDCTTNTGTCSWACNSCLRPNDIYRCPSNKDWGFTFDDGIARHLTAGPSEYSPTLLDWLKSKGIKATFFLVGSQVVQFPEVVQRQFDEGHQIAIHTWSHRALTSLTTDQVVAELEWTAQAIQQIIGVRPTYFRPPFGDIDDRVRQIAAAMGLKPVIWSYDTSDWSIYSPFSPPANVTSTVTVTTAVTLIKAAQTSSSTVTSSTTTNSTSKSTTTSQETNQGTTTVVTTTFTTTISSQPTNNMVPLVAQRAVQWSSSAVGVISLEHDIYQGASQQGPIVGQAILNAGMNLVNVASCVGDSYPYVDHITPLVVNTSSSISAPITTTSSEPSSLTTTKNGSTALFYGFTVPIVITLLVLSFI
ncbi:chitin deacetylase [Kappamyces sp. JEL0829]|nr:chitin deacetylase [Kappamyces sp. JEL0829]